MLLVCLANRRKLLSEDLGDGVEEGGGDGGEEEVGQHVDHGGGDGEGGEQRAGIWIWDLSCVLLGAGRRESRRELRTVVVVQLKQVLNHW